MNRDKIGIWTSFICIIHCVILPFIVTALPSLNVLDVGTEIFLILLAITIGSISFIDNYLKHKYLIPLIIFLFGFCQILIAKKFNLELINISGLLTLILAHWINYKEVKKRDGGHPHGCKH